MADDRTTEQELLAKYRAELTKAEDEFLQAQDKVHRYQLAVRGLEAVMQSGSAGGSPEKTGNIAKARESLRGRRGTQTGPRGEAAVARILTENPGVGYTLHELFDALNERGWISPESKNPEAATRAAANRLRQKDPRFLFKDKRFSFEDNDRYDPMQSQTRRSQPDVTTGGGE